jgi:hypothetical protein
MVTGRIPVVYVAGSGHTGSTLLALLLDSHPEICCVGETSIKPPIVKRGGGATQSCSCGVPVAQCPFWTRIFEHVRQRGYELGATYWSNDYRLRNRRAQKVMKRACASAAGRPLVRWAADNIPLYSNTVREADAVNVALMEAALAVSGARVFADTTKGLTRLVHLQRISQLDIKLVRLVRDVRGYAASAKRRGLHVADAARTWLRDQTSIAEVSDILGPGRVHQVRYEDMCGEPDATLRALWSFCGVADMTPPVVIDATEHHVLGNSMRLGGQIRVRLDQSWRERLDAGETRDILAIAGTVNRALGYA